MRVAIRVVSLVLAAAGSAGAQTPAVSGTFISMLGNDTVAIERYTRTGTKLEGDILRRYPQVGVLHYVADLSDGKFRGLSVATRAVDANPVNPPALSIVTILADSVAMIEGQRNGRPDTVLTRRRTFTGRGIPVIPGLPAALGLYEQVLASNPPVGRDTMTLVVLGSGRGPNGALSMVRRARDTVVFVGTLTPNWLEIASVDAAGRILSVDATATTVKTVARRASGIDFDATAKAWAATEAARGRAGAMSPPDTVRATIGAANIEIVYGRPYKRGRDVWGTVVEWNKPWRTGANAATSFTTSADLVFGTTLLPAGKYTLFSLPTPTGTRLIINSQTGQWGTAYDATRDFARLDMAYTTLPTPVEQFTMQIVPQGTGGVLKFSWDRREHSIPFTVR